MIGRADRYENAESATLIGAIKQSISGIDARFSGQPQLEADLRYAIGYALQNLGEIVPAHEQLEKALARRRANGSPLDVAEMLSALGIVSWWESDFKQGEQDFKQALDLLGSEATQRAIALRVDALTNFAGMLINAGDFGRSVVISHDAIALADTSPGISAATRATLWGNLATAQESLKDYPAATASFDKTLQLQREATGELHPSYAVALNNQAHLFFDMGKPVKAIANLKESLRIRRKTLGENHPQVATAFFNLAHGEVAACAFDDAEKHALAALKIAEASYKAGHPRMGKAHEALAVVFQKAGQPKVAREHALQAQRIHDNADGVDPAWSKRVDMMLVELGPMAKK